MASVRPLGSCATSTVECAGVCVRLSGTVKTALRASSRTDPPRGSPLGGLIGGGGEFARAVAAQPEPRRADTPVSNYIRTVRVGFAELEVQLLCVFRPLLTKSL